MRLSHREAVQRVAAFHRSPIPDKESHRHGNPPPPPPTPRGPLGSKILTQEIMKGQEQLSSISGLNLWLNPLERTELQTCEPVSRHHSPTHCIASGYRKVAPGTHRPGDP